jgi:hypothetical protein
MTRLQKIIIGINLLFLMAYSYQIFKPQYYMHESAINHGIILIMHLLALFFAGSFAYLLGKKDIAAAFSISMAVVLLIGFGVCSMFGN